MGKLTYAYVGDITKAERDEDGDLLVYGKATGPDLDLDEQRCDPAWLRKAMPAWAEWSNVREMHQPICAGVGMETEAKGDDWWVKSKVVDAGTAKKIESRALRGYSVGIKNPMVVKDATAPGGRIVGGEIVEISYVDRPCNPDATMAICKAVGTGGKFGPVEAEESLEVSIQVGAEKFSPADLAKLIATKNASASQETAEQPEAPDGQFVVNPDDGPQHGAPGLTVLKTAEQGAKATADEAETAAAVKQTVIAAAAGGIETAELGALVKQYGITVEQAAKVPAWLRPVVLSGKGAMPPLKPGGKPRYPIDSVQDLKDAISAFGRGKDTDKDKIQAHIKSEAKRLGRADLVPDSWKAAAADLSKADGDGAQMTHDPAELKAILGGLVGCMKAELDELMAGENELCDLYDLLCTIRMFCRWWASEALGGETAEPYDMGDTLTYIGLGADADTTKTVDTTTDTSTEDTTAADAVETETVADDATKTTDPDATKAAGSVDENRLTELVKSVTAGIQKDFDERFAALAAQNDALKTDLDKALALPEPGGPVLTRTAAQQAAARHTDAAQIKAQAAELLRKADSAADPYLAKGYRERHAELMSKAAE